MSDALFSFKQQTHHDSRYRQRNSTAGLRIASLLYPALDQTFPLKDAVAAHEHIENGEQFGKITLDIG